jgi:hypothetical protein
MAPPVTPEKFSYVFIPADPLYPIEAREFDQVSLEDDQFIKMVKKYFAMANPESGVDREMLIKQMSEHAKKDISSSLDKNTLDQLMASTSVDILTISVPSLENDFVGVSLYCDDKGKAKKLSLNERAIGLGTACGLIGQVFLGDVFLSRMYDDGEDHWFRMNFSMSDVGSDAPWVRRAAEQAAKKQSQGPASLSGLAERFLSKSGQSPAILTSDETESRAKSEGETDKYRWYQSGDEVELTFPCEASVTRSSISVDIKQKSIRVKVGSDVLLEKDLADLIDAGDSTWTFSAKDRLLQVTLVKKASGKMWDEIFKH